MGLNLRLAVYPIMAFALMASLSRNSCADPVKNDWYPIPKGSVFSTADTWVYNTVKYRLYGVQSCLRGTTFNNSHGISMDCGAASTAVLIALVQDLSPSCHTVAEDVLQRTRFVICIATLSKGAAVGAQIDLGTALITKGYGFAARRTDGSIVHPPYGVAEAQAQAQKAGLWAFPNFPNPNTIIASIVKNGGATSRFDIKP